MKWKIDSAEDLPLAVIEDTEDGIGVCEVGEPVALLKDEHVKRSDANAIQWWYARTMVKLHNEREVIQHGQNTI